MASPDYPSALRMMADNLEASPDYPSALRMMADNLDGTLEELTTRLTQRSAALTRVVEEKEAYRKALVAVLELEPTDLGVGGGTAILTRDEVHDAIGSDLIMALMYRQRVMQFLPAIEQAVRLAEEVASHPDRVEWRDAEPKTLTGVAEALEEQRLAKLFEPFPKTDLTPYLEAHDRAVEEIVAEQLAQDAKAEEVVPAVFYSKGDDPCVCTVRLDTHSIVDREATCPVHGGACCPTCGSDSIGMHGNTTLAGEPCGNRWHDA